MTEREVSKGAEVQAVLRQRAQLLAAVVAIPGAAAVEQSLLGFQVDSELYSIETSFVCRALRDVEITPLPIADACVLGLFSLQGELLLAFDLASLLRGRSAQRAARRSLLVLGREQAELAVAVDDFEGTLQLSAAELLEPPQGRGENVFVRGVTADARLVLDAAALLADPRLYIDESNSSPMGTRGQ